MSTKNNFEPNVWGRRSIDLENGVRMSVQTDAHTGAVTQEVFAQDGKYHNPHGPAFIKSRLNDAGELTPIICNYYKDGSLHRTDGPACLTYNTKGNLCREIYFDNGELHNLRGPAEIHYKADGTIDRTQYFIYGKRLDGADVEEFMERWGITSLEDMDEAAEMAFLLEVEQ